jgi:cation:H+ antiporter
MRRTVHCNQVLITSIDILRLVVGIGVLYWGAEWLIRGSATMARAFGVRALVIGLTVVAYGTSAPEVAVCTKAASEHATQLALAVVIGSCAANISLILGLTALISPPRIEGRIIRREVPVLLGSAIAVPFVLYDGVITRYEGLGLIICAALFTIATLTVSSKDDLDEETAEKVHAAEDVGSSYGGRGRPRGTAILAMVMAALGLALLVMGSNQFVHGARAIGGKLGMSDRMVGLTMIAIGTSLPELITSLIAATRGHSALAVGSVIGSNLLNVFLVLGLVAYLRPVHVGERIHTVDLIGLVAITLLGVLFMRGSRRVSRLEGALLVGAYIGFIVAASLF